MTTTDCRMVGDVKAAALPAMRIHHGGTEDTGKSGQEVFVSLWLGVAVSRGRVVSVVILSIAYCVSYAISVVNLSGHSRIGTDLAAQPLTQSQQCIFYMSTRKNAALRRKL